METSKLSGLNDLMSRLLVLPGAARHAGISEHFERLLSGLKEMRHGNETLQPS